MHGNRQLPVSADGSRVHAEVLRSGDIGIEDDVVEIPAEIDLAAAERCP